GNPPGYCGAGKERDVVACRTKNRRGRKCQAVRGDRYWQTRTGHKNGPCSVPRIERCSAGPGKIEFAAGARGRRCRDFPHRAIASGYPTEDDSVAKENRCSAGFGSAKRCDAHNLQRVRHVGCNAASITISGVFSEEALREAWLHVVLY